MERFIEWEERGRRVARRRKEVIIASSRGQRRSGPPEVVRFSPRGRRMMRLRFEEDEEEGRGSVPFSFRSVLVPDMLRTRRGETVPLWYGFMVVYIVAGVARGARRRVEVEEKVYIYV